MGVNCPSVGGANPADDFKPLQSGEYTVTYSKRSPASRTRRPAPIRSSSAPRACASSCSGSTPPPTAGVDLDLHVHQPNNTQPWGISPGAAGLHLVELRLSDFSPPAGRLPQVVLLRPGVVPPTPVDWYLDPVLEKNTCYFAPRGVGQDWQSLGMGCHNPRLDLDNITCDANVTDPNDGEFCAPENVNIDFPPNDQWIRIGVHYYSSHGLNYDVHPIIKIFCDGALAGELGSAGYYVPETPVTFAPFDGDGLSNRFWVVADVAFKHDECTKQCIVKPIYSDKAGKTPFFTNADAAVATFAPAYPPLP